MATKWNHTPDPLRQEIRSKATQIKPKVSARLPFANHDYLWGDLGDIEFAMKQGMWGYLKTAIHSLPRKALDGDDRIKDIVEQVAESCPDEDTKEMAKRRLADKNEHLPGLFEREK